MALDYDGRLDFRAFDVLCDAIERATPKQIDSAIESCDEVARNWNSGTPEHVTRKRFIFYRFARLLALYQWRFHL